MTQSEEIVYNHSHYNMQSWSKQANLNPIPVAKAEGIYVYDFEGNRYSDMSAQLVNLNVGHGCKPIIEAIKKQAEEYCYISPSYGSAPRGELAKMLVELLPDNFGKVFFTNAGADANENAIKIARMYTGRKKVFSRYRSYHGSTFGAGNLTGEPRRYPLEPGIPGFVKFFDPYIYREPIEFASEEEATNYYLAKLEEQIVYENPDDVAAIVMETVTGSNGVIIPPKGYLPGVRKICDKYGIVMICDEVMAGFGRTGKMFAFEKYGVVPDILTLAKALGGGMPLGALVASSELMEAWQSNPPLGHITTFGGHPVSCAAALAALKLLLNEPWVCEVEKKSQMFVNGLKGHPAVKEIRAAGLLIAVDLKDRTKAKNILYLLLEEGVITDWFMFQPTSFRIAPPLSISEAEVGLAIEKIIKALNRL